MYLVGTSEPELTRLLDALSSLFSLFPQLLSTMATPTRAGKSLLKRRMDNMRTSPAERNEQRKDGEHIFMTEAQRVEMWVAPEPQATVQKLELTPNSAQQNRKESPLLHLPAELRIQIYEYTVGGYFVYPKKTHCGRVTFRAKPLQSMLSNKEKFVFQQHFLGLLLVCRQIYSEATLILYSKNTFGASDRLNDFWLWLDGLKPEQKDAIGAIRCVLHTALLSQWWNSRWLSASLADLKGLRLITLFCTGRMSCHSLEREVEEVVVCVRKCVGDRKVEIIVENFHPYKGESSDED